jgi:hypothetical protein
VSRRIYFVLAVAFGLSCAMPASAQESSQSPACSCTPKPAVTKPPNSSKPPTRPCGCPVTTRSSIQPQCPAVTPTIGVSIDLGNSSSSAAKQNSPVAPTELLRSNECDTALAKAGAAEKIWDIDAAIAKYGDAISTCKLADRDRAVKEYYRLYAIKGSWWYEAGEYFPPVRLAFLYPARFILATLLLLFFIATLSPRVLPRGGVLYRMRNGLQYLFMPTFLGQAVIVTPNDLGIKSQGTLFAAALQHNARLARQLMSGDRDHLQVRSTNLLSVPSELAANTFKDLPEVKGVKIGGIFQFLLNLGRYFGWRVETDLAFFPGTAGDQARPAQMLAIATLRWAWFADRPVRVLRDVRDAQDVEDLAFAVAARILGRYFVSDEQRDSR